MIRQNKKRHFGPTEAAYGKRAKNTGDCNGVPSGVLLPASASASCGPPPRNVATKKHSSLERNTWYCLDSRCNCIRLANSPRVESQESPADLSTSPKPLVPSAKSVACGSARKSSFSSLAALRSQTIVQPLPTGLPPPSGQSDLCTLVLIPGVSMQTRSIRLAKAIRASSSAKGEPRQW